MPTVEYRFSKKGEELSQEVLDAVSSFQDHVIDKGYARSWLKNQDYIEGKYFEVYPGDDILDVGEQGEFKATFFNHFRNFYTHMYNQVTANTPAFSCSSANTDLESKRATQVGKRIVDHYHKVKRYEDKINGTTKKGICHGDGYLSLEWNPFAGEKKGKDKDKYIYNGDFEANIRTVWDVFFDYNKENKDDWLWCIFRTRKNRYDVAATFPNKKDEILAINDYRNGDRYWEFKNGKITDRDDESDDIWVYSFYHKPTPAMPEGKYALVAGDSNSKSVNLYESNKYLYLDRLPLFNLSPDEYMTECFGFTDMNSIRGPQQLMNIVLSTITSNVIAAGAQNVYAGPSGSNVDIESTVNGLNFFYGDVKPEVIDFYRDNTGLDSLIQFCKSNMETLTGQNSVVRGDVAGAPNLKSGVAIATVINMAFQYSMGLVKSYNKMFEDVYTFIIDVLKVVADSERLLEIVGKRRENDVESFTRDDIRQISRVVVERVNPISKSYAGSIEIGMELLKIGHITPDQFFDLINNGNIDFATENKERMMDLITAYKDALLEGVQVPAVPGINHRLFMQEIQSLLFDMNILTNPEKAPILQNILRLLNEQMQFVRNGDEVAEYIYAGQIPPPPGQLNNSGGLPPAMQAPPPQGAQGAQQ